jgi:hypothetical protein
MIDELKLMKFIHFLFKIYVSSSFLSAAMFNNKPIKFRSRSQKIEKQ